MYVMHNTGFGFGRISWYYHLDAPMQVCNKLVAAILLEFI
jgi:hypothetical protein